jgi:hypothetical protein
MATNVGVLAVLTRVSGAVRKVVGLPSWKDKIALAMKQMIDGAKSGSSPFASMLGLYSAGAQAQSREKARGSAPERAGHGQNRRVRLEPVVSGGEGQARQNRRVRLEPVVSHGEGLAKQNRRVRLEPVVSGGEGLARQGVAGSKRDSRRRRS